MDNFQKTKPSREDTLMQLQRKPVQSFRTGQAIYDSHHTSDDLYTVLEGHVKVTMTSDDGDEAIARIVRTDEFFGESCLAGNRPPNEAAVALDDVTVMAWTSSEIEQQVEHDPHLGIALRCLRPTISPRRGEVSVSPACLNCCGPVC
jgi:CRP-like cAMP-binding protein